MLCAGLYIYRLPVYIAPMGKTILFLLFFAVTLHAQFYVSRYKLAPQEEIKEIRSYERYISISTFDKSRGIGTLKLFNKSGLELFSISHYNRVYVNAEFYDKGNKLFFVSKDAGQRNLVKQDSLYSFDIIPQYFNFINTAKGHKYIVSPEGKYIFTQPYRYDYNTGEVTVINLSTGRKDNLLAVFTGSMKFTGAWLDKTNMFYIKQANEDIEENEFEEVTLLSINKYDVLKKRISERIFLEDSSGKLYYIGYDDFVYFERDSDTTFYLSAKQKLPGDGINFEHYLIKIDEEFNTLWKFSLSKEQGFLHCIKKDGVPYFFIKRKNEKEFFFINPVNGKLMEQESAREKLGIEPRFLHKLSNVSVDRYFYCENIDIDYRENYITFGLILE